MARHGTTSASDRAPDWSRHYRPQVALNKPYSSAQLSASHTLPAAPRRNAAALEAKISLFSLFNVCDCVVDSNTSLRLPCATRRGGTPEPNHPHSADTSPKAHRALSQPSRSPLPPLPPAPRTCCCSQIAPVPVLSRAVLYYDKHICDCVLHTLGACCSSAQSFTQARWHLRQDRDNGLESSLSRQKSSTAPPGIVSNLNRYSWAAY
jgi:hypothetical protein